MSATTHLEAAKGYIAVAESGDAKREAYLKAADEILAAQAENPKLTLAAIAEYLGKVRSWVSQLLIWRKDDRLVRDALPFSEAAKGESPRALTNERRVPTRHEDRVEMVEKLLADEKVAKAVIPQVMAKPSFSQRILSQAVHEQDAEQRRKRAEQLRQKAADKAMPLPAYMADMVVKMNEWSLGLAALVDDLDGLPEGRGRELVTIAARNLAEQAQRWVDRLEPVELPEVEDGNVIDMVARTAS